MEHADNCIGSVGFGGILADRLMLVYQKVVLQWYTFISDAKELDSPRNSKIQRLNLAAMVANSGLLCKVKS